MVLIAAAVCTKAGKTLISRQFVEMTKLRIEGLLAAFPKLISAGKQHTFVETESVRYVYQPLEKLYILLITTTTSNILEDLENLRLFARVITEYCKTFDELEICDNAFDLIFAFDEIVALGYRESVNLGQIRTFVEMDSHDEKVYLAIKLNKEREAKKESRKREKELKKQRVETNNKGVTRSSGIGSGFGSASNFIPTGHIGDTANYVPEPVKPSYKTMHKISSGSTAMKLGGKSRDIDSFVDQLKEEGENVLNLKKPSGPKISSIVAEDEVSHGEPVHLKQEEKLSVKVRRDGGVHQFELHGLVTLNITDEKWGRIRVQLDNTDNRLQFQTHPNVDKELFKSKNQIGLKIPLKPFPLNTDVGVLKWRLQTQDESALPISINCWPNENGNGGCEVNIEYVLEMNMELRNVQIKIPLPIGANPVVSECDGQYLHEARKNLLVWSLPIIDSSNKSGSVEFSVHNSIPSDFFPMSVSFMSYTPYAKIKVRQVNLVDTDEVIKHSEDTIFVTEHYEVL